MVQRILEAGDIESLDHNAIPRLLLPQAASAFAARAARLRQLAGGAVGGTPVDATLGGYLLLMAALVDAQAAVSVALPRDAVTLPPLADMQQALAHRMPLIPVGGERDPVWRRIFSSLLDRLDSLAAAPPQLSAVLGELRGLDAAALDACADAVLAQDGAAVNALHAPFVAAALQVLWTVQAGMLHQLDVPVLETGTLCPVCGSHPVASAIRIGGQSQGYRYLQCGICTSEWHMVRVKCSTCESNSQIAYRSLDAIDAAALAQTAKPRSKANDPKKVARAETCEDCHSYRKIFNQEHDYYIEPLADDLASLTLDLLVSAAGYDRASGNPLLWFSAQA
ncbi:formate dehydrogenase accessory protein FdhE [Rugamonas sp.]|uniref:formate dehydrogenase accessory protein FdhE n=1 Tax=Rugamonas sp. TaxID=1926287 RepID=UPI0025E9E878|nr:formate dehydrogenase accessory protein FdhE [Rugamonas sp.]